jgi:hypothetical protein
MWRLPAVIDHLIAGLDVLRQQRFADCALAYHSFNYDVARWLCQGTEVTWYWQYSY